MVLTHPNKMGTMRYYAFDQYAFGIGSNQLPVSNQDVETLQTEFVHNNEEPMIFRCRAACALLQLAFHRGDTEAVEGYRKKARALMRKRQATGKGRLGCDAFETICTRVGPTP